MLKAVRVLSQKIIMSSAFHLKTVNKFTVTDLILMYVISMGIVLWLSMASYFFREKSCSDQQVKPRVFVTVFLLFVVVVT